MGSTAGQFDKDAIMLDERILTFDPEVMRGLTRYVRQWFAPVLYRSRFTNFYHCCQQRTASRWMFRILSDPVIYRYSGLAHLDPVHNFVAPQHRQKLRDHQPTGCRQPEENHY